MKQITGLTLFAVLSVAICFAQEAETQPYISKGQWMLGGTLSFSTTDDFIRKPDFSISPMAGYFIGKRWAIGLDASYSISTISNEYEITVGRLSTIPFARYYFGVGKLAPFAEAGFGMSWNYSEGDETSNYQSYKLGAGLNYFISPSVALEGKLMYSRYTEDRPMNPINLGIGLQFFFSKNQAAKEAEATFLQKGTWMIGGSIDLTLSDNNYSDNLFQDHHINPMAGYFVSDKLAIGLAMYYTYYSIYESHSQSLTAAPFARYYFKTQRFAPFAEVAFGGSMTKVKYFDGVEDQTLKDENFSYGAAGGFNYFITDFVALETKLSYLRNNNDGPGSIGLKAGLSFFLSR